MSKLCIFLIIAASLFGYPTFPTYAYEINNHADMTQSAALISKLNTATKLNQIGLRAIAPINKRQVFPVVPISGPLPEIRYCFGEYLPEGSSRAYDANPNGRVQDASIEQPDWAGRKFTIVQLLRYGTCFEDSEDPFKRPLSHFYDVQNDGKGLAQPFPESPSSLLWSLRRDVGTSNTGLNHYDWQDARESFFQAITLPTQAQRANAWGVTFQALGHIQHHLQDMASPQHVRNDTHCNATVCAFAFQYRPSGYEYYFDQRFQLIRSLAESATTPMMFGLPREFWNANTTNALITINPSRPMNSNEGLAAYTSTNFVSAGRDFRLSQGMTQGVQTLFPASEMPFPRPTQTTSNTPITEFFSANANLERVRVKLCGGVLANCVMRFIGTEANPSARASALSLTSHELLRPNGTYGGRGFVQQNFFTYTDAAIKLVPKAVEYSAGIIDYFFRGEMSVRLPAEGVYGLIDGGDPASNCKDSCGFKKLKVRLKNVTAPINGVAQDFLGGSLTAVVKFSRNSCFLPDFSADPGPLYAYNPSCFVPNGLEPIEEQVISDPIAAPFSLAAGAETALTLTFTNPIPVNAWDIKLQFVYRGQLGLEEDSVAVHTHRLSSPTPLRYLNEYDYLLINQKLYTRAEVNASQTLLNQVVPTSCVTGSTGSRQLAATCFNPQTISTAWTGTNGVTLANLTSLPTNSHAMWVYLIDYFGQTSASFPGPLGTNALSSFFARDMFSPDADPSQVGFDSFIRWRNLQGWQTFSRYHLASTDQTMPSLTVMNQRPSFPTTTPVKMTSVNF